jgi:hypothetical protein
MGGDVGVEIALDLGRHIRCRLNNERVCFVDAWSENSGGSASESSSIGRGFSEIRRTGSVEISARPVLAGKSPTSECARGELNPYALSGTRT